MAASSCETSTRPRRRCRSGRRRRPRGRSRFRHRRGAARVAPRGARASRPGAARRSGRTRGSGARRPSGRRPLASIRRDRRAEHDNESGKEERPSTMNAVSTPSQEMRAGARAAPIPIEASQSIWITPKTRARTSSGTARWTSVSPATSTSELPIPMSASATTGDDDALPDADRDERHADHRRCPPGTPGSVGARR